MTHFTAGRPGRARAESGGEVHDDAQVITEVTITCLFKLFKECESSLSMFLY